MVCFLHPMVPSHLRCPSYIIFGISNHSMQNNFFFAYCGGVTLISDENKSSFLNFLFYFIGFQTVHYDQLLRVAVWKWQIVMRALTLKTVTVRLLSAMKWNTVACNVALRLVKFFIWVYFLSYQVLYSERLFIPFNPANENAPNLHFIFLTFQKCNSDFLDSRMETVIESPTGGSMQLSSKEQLNL